MSLYCSDPVPAFVQDICANEQSRITAIALIRSDNTTLSGYTTAAEWINGIAGGTIIVIKNVRGEKPKSSPVTIDGFGKEKTRQVGRDFSLSYAHPDVIGNIDFYNALNYAGSYQIAYYTQGGKIFVEPEAIATIDADYVIPVSTSEIITWDVAVTWSAQSMPEAYTAPTSVFE